MLLSCQTVDVVERERRLEREIVFERERETEAGSKVAEPPELCGGSFFGVMGGRPATWVQQLPHPKWSLIGNHH